jgi:HEAT repeat protein
MRILAMLLCLLGLPGVVGAGDPPKRLDKTLLQWLKQLDAKDAKVRVQACQALGDFGRAGKDAVGPLAKLLKDEKGDVRYAAADALRRIGPPAKDAVPALAKLLEDDDPSLRAIAARALGGIGPLAKDTAQGLLKAVGDRETAVALAALEGLGGVGPPGEGMHAALRRALKDPDPAVRVAALQTWADVLEPDSYDPKAVAAALRDAKPEVCHAALATWMRLYRGRNEAIKGLIGLLGDTDPAVRREAVKGLEMNLPAEVTAELIAALRKALEDRDGTVRVRAVQALAFSEGTRDKPEPGHLEVLHKALADDDAGVRIEAIDVVRWLNFERAKMVALLEPLLKDKSPAVRLEVAAALIDEKDMVPGAWSALVKLLDHADADVRAAALRGLRGPKAEAAQQVVFGLVEKDPNPGVRQAAVKALQHVNAPKQEHIGAVEQRLADASLSVRIVAAAELAKLQPCDAKAVKVLTEALNHEDAQVRLTAVREISRTRAFEGLTEPLKTLLAQDPSPQLRRLVWEILNLNSPEVP